MADVVTKCISANDQISGRAISRVPNSRLFKVEPKNNVQQDTTALTARYDDRFDDRAYYFDIAAQ